MELYFFEVTEAYSFFCVFRDVLQRFLFLISLLGVDTINSKQLPSCLRELAAFGSIEVFFEIAAID